MAKYTPTPVSSLSQSMLTTINQNLQDISEAMEKTLSRDGEIPNQMEADLDMNGNDLINVNSVSADKLVIDGTDITNWTDQIIEDVSRAEEAADAALAAANAGEEAADAALAAANAGFVFDTVADAQGANVPPILQFIRTSGYSTAGDGGGALYKRVETEPTHAGKIQSADGAWWEIAEGQAIHVEMFGAVRGLDKSNVAANDAAFANADAFMYAKGGGTVYMLGQFYCLTKLRWSPGVYFEGAGFGRWLPSFNTVSKTWDGTNLVAVAATKDYNVTGITSMRYAGGWREDPDDSGRYFKLTSFMNADADGTTPATPRDLQVFAVNKEVNSDKGGLRRCRLVPWIGTDGVSDYDLTSGNDLGDDIDVGVMLNSMEGARLEDVQIRGYWRVAGLAEIEPDFAEFGRSENNVLTNVSSQGFVGLMVRSGDRWEVSAATSSSVTIRWSEESYWPSSGQFEAPGIGYVTYTGTSRDVDNLTLTGCSEDVSSVTQIRAPMRGIGFSTGRFTGCDAWGLWHHSGQSAETLGFSMPSKATEISGYPMRGLHFIDYSSIGDGDDDCNIFVHDCYDAVFVGGKFELGRAIASPAQANSSAAAPAGETRNIRLNTHWSSTVDTTLWTPRSTDDIQRQMNPIGRLSENLLIEALVGQDIDLRVSSGGVCQVLKSDGTTSAIFRDSGNADIKGQLNIGTSGTGLINYPNGKGFGLREGTSYRFEITATAGSVIPGADNSQALGNSTRRWSEVYAGTGSINTSDAREKLWRGGLNDAEIRVARRLSGLIGIYRWKSAINEKGKDARFHCGVTAQDVEFAFEAEGLDGTRYGVLCYDEWDDRPAEYDDEGNEIRPAETAGGRYGIRYDELLAFIAAGFEARLSSLEQGV